MKDTDQLAIGLCIYFFGLLLICGILAWKLKCHDEQLQQRCPAACKACPCDSPKCCCKTKCP